MAQPAAQAAITPPRPAAPEPGPAAGYSPTAAAASAVPPSPPPAASLVQEPVVSTAAAAGAVTGLPADPRSPSDRIRGPRSPLNDPRLSAPAVSSADVPSSPAAAATPPPASPGTASGAAGASLAEIVAAVQQAGGGSGSGVQPSNGSALPQSNIGPGAQPSTGPPQSSVAGKQASAALPAGLDLSKLSDLAAILGIGGGGGPGMQQPPPQQQQQQQQLAVPPQGVLCIACPALGDAASKGRRDWLPGGAAVHCQGLGVEIGAIGVRELRCF